MAIIIDVPHRGRPDTTVITSPRTDCSFTERPGSAKRSISPIRRGSTHILPNLAPSPTAEESKGGQAQSHPGQGERTSGAVPAAVSGVVGHDLCAASRFLAVGRTPGFVGVIGACL